MPSDPELLLKQLDAHKTSLLNAQKAKARAVEYKRSADEAAKKAAESATAADELHEVASSSGVLLIDAIRAYAEGDDPPAEPPAESPAKPKPPPNGSPSFGHAAAPAGRK